jgi:hypothetical protein
MNDKGGFRAVQLNDSFEEEVEEEEEEEDDVERTPTTSFVAREEQTRRNKYQTPNNNETYETPMTSFKANDINTNSNAMKTSEVGFARSTESSPSGLESRDKVSNLPETPKRHYFDDGEYRTDHQHHHNRSMSATSMDGLINRLDEESLEVGETTNVRFDDYRGAFVGRPKRSALDRVLDVQWCFGETRKQRKNFLSCVLVLAVITFMAVPLRHWK